MELKEKRETKPLLSRIKVPHVYVIILSILLLVTLLTYVIPAGEYARIKDPVSGRTIVDPTSFQYVDQKPVSLFKMFEAIPTSINTVVDIIFLVVLVSASFEIIKATGTFISASYYLARVLKGKELLLLSGATILFSCMGAFLGWAEGLLVFIPLGMSLASAIGADALVGVGMVVLGGMAGFTSGVINIYTTGVAQSICGLPLFSGIEYRLACLAIFTLMAIFMLWRYTTTIKKDPEKSLVYGMKNEFIDTVDLDNTPPFTMRHKLILLVVIVGFVIVTYGAVKAGWSLKDRMAAFIIMGILGGIIGGLNPDRMAEEFAKGARLIIPSALTIGFARAIMIVLERGLILDPIIRFFAGMLQLIPSSMVAAVMVIVQAIINFFINSGSGQATVTMPIIAPLADMVNIPRQVAVLAFQFGDGFTNAIWPTSGFLMGGLALGGGIPWEKWAKWVLKLMISWYIVGCIVAIVGTIFKFGPF